jgi:hypothetical protein
MVSRFKKQANGTLARVININGITYKLTVNESVWNTKNVSRHVVHWKNRIKEGKGCDFKYGTVEVCDEPETHRCDECDKEYKSRSGLLRHIKAKHPPSEPETTLSEPAAVTSITNNNTNNIENQTNNNTTINNIQNNIIIRPFGKENPKWITEKVILEALQNIPGAIMKLVKEKHFNDRFPENRNVELCNEFKNRYVTVQGEERKVKADRMFMLERMCSNACDAVTTTLESYSDPPDSDESEDEDETPEDRRCKLIASRIRSSDRYSALVDGYISKWEDYIRDVPLDGLMKDADHYITMLLLDLKLALAHEEEMRNVRETA